MFVLKSQEPIFHAIHDKIKLNTTNQDGD